MLRTIVTGGLWIALLLAGGARAQDGSAPGSAPAETGEARDEAGAPVPLVVWNRQIVEMRLPLGSIGLEERVQRAAERVLAVPEESQLLPVEADEVQLGSLRGVNLSLGGIVLFTVFEGDVDPIGRTLEQAVDDARVALREVYEARADQRSLSAMLRSVGLVAAATAALLVVLRLLFLIRRAVVRRVRTRVARSERLRLRGVDLRPYVGETLERVVGIAGLFLYGTAIYLWLEYSLARFPYTSPWSDALGDRLWSLGAWVVQGVASAVPGLAIVGLVFFVTRGTARTITLIVSRIERRAERSEGFAPESVRATRRLAIVVVWIFGIVLAYPHIPGADSDAFKGISVLLGLMISLGSAGLVNQWMSGFVVLYSRAVRSGEVVRIGDVEGQVTDLGLLSTKLLLPTGEEVSIPNAVVVTHRTTNYSRGPGGGRAIASTAVTIGYDTPWRQVRALLLLAAQRTEGIVRDPAPRVAQEALSDWFVEYRLVFQVEDGKQRAAVVARVHAAIQDAFNEYGVQIMSPHFVGQPERPVLVPRGGEEPDPAPRFRFAKEAPPASFDPAEKAAQERAQRAAEEAARAERARLRAEREQALAEERAHEKAGERDEEESGKDDEQPEEPDPKEGPPPEAEGTDGAGATPR